MRMSGVRLLVGANKWDMSLSGQTKGCHSISTEAAGVGIKIKGVCILYLREDGNSTEKARLFY